MYHLYATFKFFSYHIRSLWSTWDFLFGRKIICHFFLLAWRWKYFSDVISRYVLGGPLSKLWGTSMLLRLMNKLDTYNHKIPYLVINYYTEIKTIKGLKRWCSGREYALHTADPRQFALRFLASHIVLQASNDFWVHCQK